MIDFDDLKNKAEDLIEDHGDKLEQGIDKLADLAGDRLGHEAQIEKAAEKAKEFIEERQAPGAS
jgi:hypothetical protein